jgi:hypothetical protein
MSVPDTIEYFKHNDRLIALCIRHDHTWRQTNFLTPDSFYQQIGLLNYAENDIIRVHAHREIPRTVHYTSEVLLCVSGRVLFSFYNVNEDWKEISSCELTAGDVLCLFNIGHGAKIIEPARLIEIKQGPFLGVNEKYYMDEEQS